MIIHFLNGTKINVVETSLYQKEMPLQHSLLKLTLKFGGEVWVNVNSITHIEV